MWNSDIRWTPVEFGHQHDRRGGGASPPSRAGRFRGLPHRFNGARSPALVDHRHRRGKQPLHSEVGDLALVCNGEIYNHERLRRELQDRYHFRTHSDSEVILHLYEDLGPASVTKLDGMFAFVLSDGKQVFAARDPLGIKPLYTGRDADDGLWFASELKALIDVCASIEEVPPGAAYAGGTVWSSCCKWARIQEAYQVIATTGFKTQGPI